VDGKAQLLPVTEHRARFEITLRGNCLPARLLEDWKAYDFTDIAPFFKFQRLKPNLNPFVQAAVDQIDQIGEAYDRKTKHGTTRKFSATTVADKELNDKAYSSLKELTKRLQKRTLMA
jgi:hypothetical protein